MHGKGDGICGGGRESVGMGVRRVVSFTHGGNGVGGSKRLGCREGRGRVWDEIGSSETHRA